MKNNLLHTLLTAELNKNFMPFDAVVTPDDLMLGDLINAPGWYPIECVKYVEKEAGTDKSVNLNFNFKILDGPDKGKIANVMVNEKALGMGKKLWEVAGIPKQANGGYHLSTSTVEKIVGLKCMGYVKRTKNQKSDKEYNDIADMKPMAKVG